MHAPTIQEYTRYLVNGKPFVTHADAMKEAATLMAERRAVDIRPGLDTARYQDAKACWRVYTELVVATTARLIHLAEQAPQSPANITAIRRQYRDAKQGGLVVKEIAMLERHIFNEQYAMRQVSSTGRQAWQRQADLQATFTRVKHLKHVLADFPQFGADHMPIVPKPQASLEDLRTAEYVAQAITPPAPSMPIEPDWQKIAPTTLIERDGDLVQALQDAEFTTKAINTMLWQAPRSIGDTRLNKYRESLKKRDRLDNQMIGATLSYSWNPSHIEQIGD